MKLNSKVCLGALVLLAGCGALPWLTEDTPDAAQGPDLPGPGGGPDAGPGGEPDEPTPGLPPPASAIIEDGVAGGTFHSDDNQLVVVVPTGALPRALRAHPVVRKVPLPADLAGPNDQVLSAAYEVDLQSSAGFSTTASVTVALNVDLSQVPAATRTARYVFARLIDDEDLHLPVPGRLGAGLLTVELRGLARKATFAVVYNPDMAVAVTVGARKPSALPATQPAPWQTNSWTAWYNGRGGALGVATLDVLGTPTGAPTPAQIAAVVKEKVTDNAARSGVIYQQAGLRQPNLVPLADPVLTGGATYTLPIIIQPVGGSMYRFGERDHVGALRYGVLIVEPEEIADVQFQQKHPGFGLMLEGVSHELLHAIQAGYDIGGGVSTQGLNEGSATTYGMTIDQAARAPQVRTVNRTEIQRLSSYLGAPKRTRSEAYANQDFFAYVGRAQGGNDLGYLAAVFEQIRLDREAAIAAHKLGADLPPSLPLILGALDKVMKARFGRDLPSVYVEYVRQRAVEHGAASRLRGNELQPGFLARAIFHTDAVVAASADPVTLADHALEGRFAGLTPFSTRALVITPTRGVPDGVTAQLALAATATSASKSFRAVLYRSGLGSEIGGSRALPHFAESAGDVLTLLVANIDPEKTLDLSYRLGVTKNSFTATILVNGNSVPFTAVSVYAGAYGEYTGAVHLTNLPSMSASEGTLTDPIHTTIAVLTDPRTITGPGTFAFGGAQDVIEGRHGASVLSFFTPAIRNLTDDSFVAFMATGGSITFTAYGKNLGDRLTGTYTAPVLGTRDVKRNPDGSIEEVKLLGTISGAFDVEMAPAPTP